MSLTLQNASWELRDEAQTEAVGAALSQAFRPGDFVGLIGPLGAGKTCLTRGIMSGLEAHTRVTSPTYTLLNHYSTPRFGVVLHADLYRLDDLDDLASTGYWDELEGCDLALVEWIDKIPEAWPDKGFEVTLDHVEERRSMTLAWRGSQDTARLREAIELVCVVVTMSKHKKPHKEDSG